MTLDWRDIPYSKGFVLTKQRFPQIAHYECLTLPSGWYLWSDNATQTDLAESGDGDFVVIRGHWVDTSDDAVSGATAKQLLESVQSEKLAFHRRIGRLGGRFVIAVKTNEEVLVYNDATGLRSVYYSTSMPIVAAHLNLLADLVAEQPQYSYKDTIRALDATPYRGIRQLLPNFRLDAESSNVERFYPFEKNRYASMSAEGRLTHVEKIWRRVMSYYTSLTDKLALSITGGLDSKLMLAMCRDDSTKFAAYTYGMTEASDARSESLNFDFRQVQSMLPHIDVKSHEFLDITNPAPVSKELGDVIRSNTWASHGRYLVPLYRSAFPSDGWYHLRGNGVEIVRRFWPNSATELSALLKPLSTRDGPPLEQRAKQLGYNQAQYGFDLTDLLYWEVRMGKWHAELVNEQDAAFDTFLPMSVRDIIEALLAFSETEREQATAIYELINRNSPVLNFWGANDARNIYEQWRDTTSSKGQDEEVSLPEVVGRVKEQSPAYTLSFARDEFVVGNTKKVLVHSAQRAGALSFVIDQPYRKKSGEGYFEWHVKVDGEIKLRCDGAITMTPTTVTVWNMPKNMTVEVELIANKTGPQDSDSWQRASRLDINRLVFFADHLNGDERFAIASDNPYVEEI